MCDNSNLTEKDLEKVSGGNTPETPEQINWDLEAFKETFWYELEKLDKNTGN